MMVPLWIFWMLLLIIIFLLSVILIRDKGIRAGLINLFSLVGNRIQQTKVKLALQKEQERLAELLLELGKKTSETRLFPTGTETIQAQLNEYLNNKKQAAREIEKQQGEIQRITIEFDQFNLSRRNSLEEQENLKKPIVEKLNQLKKELSFLQKETGSQEKLKTRYEKKIKQHQERLAEIAADSSLSKKEKQDHTRELKVVVTDLAQQIENLNQALEPSYENKGNPAHRIEKLKSELLAYEQKIKQIADEQKRGEKEFETSKKLLKKQIDNLIASEIRLNREADILFKKLGAAAAKNRCDDPQLTVYYSRLEHLEGVLKRLQRQLRV